MTRRIAIVIDSSDPTTVAEAWRAAVGVTLRGDRVVVATRAGSADGGATAARARATLALFGHDVDADPDQVVADHYEQWGAVTPAAVARRPHPVVHLVRPGRRVGAVGPGDRVLELGSDVDADAIVAALVAPVLVW